MSLRDPINGPSYKPSPLKPLPWFMRKALNHSVEAQREPSVPNTYLQPAQPSTGPNSGLSTICPSRASTPGQGRSRRCSPAIPDVPLPGNTEVTAGGWCAHQKQAGKPHHASHYIFCEGRALAAPIFTSRGASSPLRYCLIYHLPSSP